MSEAKPICNASQLSAYPFLVILLINSKISSLFTFINLKYGLQGRHVYVFIVLIKFLFKEVQVHYIHRLAFSFITFNTLCLNSETHRRKTVLHINYHRLEAVSFLWKMNNSHFRKQGDSLLLGLAKLICFN